MVVYLDVYFIINLLMNFIILNQTGNLMKSSAGRIRLLTGAAFGAAIAALNLSGPYFLRTGIPRILIHIITATAMCCITYKIRNIRDLLKTFITVNICACVLAGIMSYLYYAIRMETYLKNMFLMGSGLAYLILKLIGEEVIYRFSGYKAVLYDVELKYRGKCVTARALLDSGNSLTVPESGTPVHVVEMEVLNRLIEGLKFDNDFISVVPYHSIGKKSGVMKGIRIDGMIIRETSEKHGIYDVLDKPVMAVYCGKLSQKDEYGILLNNCLLKKI